MTSCELPLIQLSNPGDLIETVPYLLGFHPSESLVLVGFARRGAGLQRVTVTLRIDLPADSSDFADELPLVEAFRGSGSDAVVVVMVTDSPSGDPRDQPRLAAIAARLAAELDVLGLAVLDLLVATDHSWWSLLCTDLDCCPREGSKRGRSSSAAAAQATYAGMVALPDRQALAATLDGEADARRAELLPAIARAEHKRDAAALPASRRRWQRAEIAAILKASRRREAGRLSDDQIARFVVGLADDSVRDALWLAIDSGAVDAAQVLVQLHSRAPRTHVAAALFLYGWCQWRAGNGTLAMMAAECALAADRQCSAASLLISAVQHGLDPTGTPPLADFRRVD